MCVGWGEKEREEEIERGREREGRRERKNCSFFPHLQSILLWLFWRWDLVNCLP
jgi:hypothetical protein